jgi:hypothetical protein
LSGTPFGTTGSSEASNNPVLAFDGDTNTFFRGTSLFNQYIGVDLGAASQVAAPHSFCCAGQLPHSTNRHIEVDNAWCNNSLLH